MLKLIKLIPLLVSCLLLIACSDESNNTAEAKKDHVWKEQTDAIDKAKEVEGILQDSAEKMRISIEEQGQ